ncbi:hypothetical protein [Bhargavaea cecembensis]|uniref:hypothetical protein n=1 Tax=Bhargavaea cecembensis TaxID=394098 RepID=UPI0009EDDE47|nr:hypothetical protein [Bhargavaea cecembensis]
MLTKTGIAFIGSLLITFAGMLRLLTESLSATTLFVACLFVVTGLIGIISNGVKLMKPDRAHES